MSASSRPCGQSKGAARIPSGAHKVSDDQNDEAAIACEAGAPANVRVSAWPSGSMSQKCKPRRLRAHKRDANPMARKTRYKPGTPAIRFLPRQQFGRRQRQRPHRPASITCSPLLVPSQGYRRSKLSPRPFGARLDGSAECLRSRRIPAVRRA